MINDNYYSSNEDLLQYFQNVVDWKEIVEAYETPEFSDAKKYAETEDDKFAFAPADTESAVEYYQSVLDSLGEIAGKELSQKAQKLDQEGLKFENGTVTVPQDFIDIFNKINDAGLVPNKIRRDYGGLGTPAVVNALMTEISARADVSLSMAIGLLNVAEALQHFGSEEQKQRLVTKMAAGEYMGAMALTEPNFGSDLSSVMTKAVKQDDGTYRLTGTKRFISQGCGLGDRPCIILTLARTGSPTSGARGLSFFAVNSKDCEVGGIEHKMGIKCSPTCEIIMDNSPGEIIGEEGFGLTRYSMGMMNDARLNIAATGVGVASAALAEAQKYAAEREQFGRTINQLPAVKRMLDHMERETYAMRVMVGEAARSYDFYAHRQERLEHEGKTDKEIRKDEVVSKWNKIASLLTPMAKCYGSEMGNVVASEGVQIHGGAGYTEEYDVARIYRDARILTIYEGTTQLQVVAMIGGVVAGLKPTGHFRKYLEEEMGKFSPSETTLELLKILEEAVTIYNEIGTAEVKGAMAFEVCNIASRFMSSMLLERAVTRLPEEKKARVQAMSKAFNIDSMAIVQGDIYQLRAAAKTPAAV